MTITEHVIERFQERITFEKPDVIRFFIEQDLADSEHLYSINKIEKRIKNGVIYVIDCTNQNSPTVITLYLNEKNWEEEEYVD